MQDSIDGLIVAIRRSHMLRLLSVGLLSLLLPIPIGMIGYLISERQARRQSVVAEGSSKWGTTQALTDPVFVIP